MRCRWKVGDRVWSKEPLGLIHHELPPGAELRCHGVVVETSERNVKVLWDHHDPQSGYAGEFFTQEGLTLVSRVIGGATIRKEEPGEKWSHARELRGLDPADPFWQQILNKAGVPTMLELLSVAGR